MHGIIHKTLENYIVERTDEDSWETIVDRADVEPTLYLQVSHYDDREIDAILETVSAMATQDRRTIERNFGRTLAPALVTTFGAHIRNDWGILDLLAALDDVFDEIDSANSETTLPSISTQRDGDEVRVTYRTQRDRHYCAMAHGILEGLLDAFDTDGTVTEQACVRDGDDDCRFLVVAE